MQKSKIKDQNLIIALSIIMVFSLLTGCRKKEIEKIVTPQAIPVKVAKVALKELNEEIEYAGNIRAKDEAIIYPKVSGKIIEKIKQDGNSVNKGEIIAYIDRDEVGLKFEKAPVESSLTGIIGRVYVDIGEHVNTQTPIALVVDMDKVKIELDIPEKYLSKISLGQIAKIKVEAYTEEEFSGKLTKISPVIELSTRTAPVEITLDNSGHRLMSGMFAKVNLIIEKHVDVPIILKESVIGKEPDTYVYIIVDKKAVLKKVVLGIRQGPYYEVKEGLREFDAVVIVGQQKLYDGAMVNEEENNNQSP